MRWRNSLLILAGMLVFPHVMGASYSGRLEWVYTIPMHSVISGKVVKTGVKSFQKVKKGQLLVLFEQREHKAALLHARSLMKFARLNLADKQRELSRTEELFDRGFIAIEELNQVKLKLAAAELELAKAEEMRAQALSRLELTGLRAPENGVILKLEARAGQTVFRSANPVLVMAPNTRLLVRILMTENKLARYKLNQKAQVIIRDKTYPGRIYSMAYNKNRIDPEGPVYEVDIIFSPSSADDFRPPMKAVVKIP